MKLTHCLTTGLLSLALTLAAGLAQAKPDRHEIERLLPHNQIKRHIEHKKEMGRRFYNDDHRSHSDGKHSKGDRQVKSGKGHKHNRRKPGHYYHPHSHYGDRYYNGWNSHRHHRGHRHYSGGRHGKPYYKPYRYPHFSSSIWHDHRRHGYRHKRHKGHHYYYNRAGFYFPGFGLIKHGHKHGRHCPDWHLEPFIAGVVLSSIINSH